MKDQTEEANQLQQQVVSLQADLKESKAGLERAETSRVSVSEDLQNQLTTEREKLSKLESNMEKV